MLQQHVHCPWATTIIKLIIFVAYGVCWVGLCCRNPPNSDMDTGSLLCSQMLMHVIAWGGGVTDTEGESVPKVDSGRKIPCGTRELNLHQWRDSPMLCPTELHPITIASCPQSPSRGWHHFAGHYWWHGTSASVWTVISAAWLGCGDAAFFLNILFW